MKKIINGLLLLGMIFAICTFLGACVDKDTGTVIPTSTDMRKNLELVGYTVELDDELENGYSGTHLTAKKENECIEVYWLDDFEACDYYYNLLGELYPSNKLVEIIDDEKFGNIVYCGSESAINASRIKIVKVTSYLRIREAR